MAKLCFTLVLLALFQGVACAPPVAMQPTLSVGARGSRRFTIQWEVQNVRDIAHGALELTSRNPHTEHSDAALHISQSFIPSSALADSSLPGGMAHHHMPPRMLADIEDQAQAIHGA